jgi:hypothetical protein
MSFHDLHVQFWQEIFARPGGPLAFRFILQPVIASIFAVRDGWGDAQSHRKPYLWSLLNDPIRRMPRLLEGLTAVSRVLLLGAGMDLVYQAIELHAFRPIETVVIALGLAFLPYLIMRGPAARISRRILRRRVHRTVERAHAAPGSSSKAIPSALNPHVK